MSFARSLATHMALKAALAQGLFKSSPVLAKTAKSLVEEDKVPGSPIVRRSKLVQLLASKPASLETIVKKMKRQASVLVIRFITKEYDIPLGVWVVREAVRKAMNSEPLKFSDHDLMLNYAKLIGSKKFSYNIDSILKQSKLMDKIYNQTTLGRFL